MNSHLIPHANASPLWGTGIRKTYKPFASRLLDEGQILSRRVGTHRRAFVKDVLAYRERQHAARRAALDELAAESQRLNLGY